MPVLQLAELSWVEVGELDKTNTVVLLPVGPLEEHGPHLPIGTDFFGASDIAEMAAELLTQKAPQLSVVLMPGLPLGSCGVTSDFAGTISIRGSTMRAVMHDLLLSLAVQGFKYVVISNHHLDPVHVKAMLLAIGDAEAEHPIRIAETGSRIVYAGIPTREEQIVRGLSLDPGKEIHADVKETSYIGYRYPHLIKGDLAGLDSVTVDIEAGFRQGKTTFKQMGALAGYLGTPSLADDRLGRVHLEEGAELTADLALRLINKQKLPEINSAMQAILEHMVKLD